MTTSAVSAAATVELGDVLPEIPEDHLLVRFIRKKYKCIMVFMLFFICAQQMSSTLLQTFKANPMSAENINEILKMLKQNATL